jgi:hypothetical protein
MIPYQKEKTENAICFFAKEHYKKTKKHLDMTSLFKYLAFFDFETFEKKGRPALGLQYEAMERGPVPIDLYQNRAKLTSDCYAFVCTGQNEKGNELYVVQPKGAPNLDYFSPFEVKEMEKIIEIYADSSIKSSHRSDASHERIVAWKKTWKKKKYSLIDYVLTFDKDPAEKPASELTFAEECYLTSRALNR